MGCPVVAENAENEDIDFVCPQQPHCDEAEAEPNEVELDAE